MSPRLLLGTLLALLAAAAPASAATLTVQGTTLVYSAAAGKVNLIDVDQIGVGQVNVDTTGGDTDPIVSATIKCVAAVNGFDCSDVSAFRAILADGDDAVEAGGLTQTTADLRGGDGDDRLTDGDLADILDGGAGSDTLTAASGGADTLAGGDGGDHLLLTPDGTPDVATGGSGVDTVIHAGGAPGTSAALTLGPGADDGPAGEGDNVGGGVEDIALSVFAVLLGGGPELVSVSGSNNTLRGDAGPNSVVAGEGDDDIDPLAGNDTVDGREGDDTITTRDGFYDRVACGTGADTARVDAFDTVAEDCETVEADGTPSALEDRPPAVTFSVPGALGSGVTTLAATATDDRGVSAVQFLDDDRIVCTDDSAPYTCDYQPRGEDVGRNTLLAVAIDGAQQTATATAATTVARFTGELTARTRRRGARRITTGRLALPAPVSPALGCTGKVRVTLKRGGRRVSRKQAKLRPDCTFRSRARARGRVKATARFLGNAAVAPDTA